MTDPQDIEVEPTPEERCSVAMAALRACCSKIVCERNDGVWTIRAHVTDRLYLYAHCEDSAARVADTAVLLREQLFSIKRSVQ